METPLYLALIYALYFLHNSVTNIPTQRRFHMVFRSLLMAGVSALFLSACGQASVSPSTSIVPDAAEPSTLTIDYEKFTLDNGLDVILQVDRSDPIVAVTTVIHAGSNLSLIHISEPTRPY